MKKIAIVLLSLSLCSPVFGMNRGFKRALDIAGKVACGGLFFGPGFLRTYGMHMQPDNSSWSPASKDLEKKAKHFAQEKNIDVTNLQVKTYHTGYYCDNPVKTEIKMTGNGKLSKSIIIGTNFIDNYLPNASKEDRELAENALIKHGLFYLKDHTDIKASAMCWTSGILGYIAYSVLSKHPMARLAKAIPNATKTLFAAKIITPVATALGIHFLMMTKLIMPYYKSSVTKADLSIKDPKEVIALKTLWANKFHRPGHLPYINNGSRFEPSYLQRAEELGKHLAQITNAQQDEN